MHPRTQAVYRRMHMQETEIDRALDQIIFVFGSNLAGIHGAGAAKDAAEDWGAKQYHGIGLVGQSYAIPTKGHNIETLPLYIIKYFVRQFIQFAGDHADYEYQVTAIGCGLAGYKPEQIAPMFRGHGGNVHLPLGWDDIIEASIVRTKFGKELPI